MPEATMKHAAIVKGCKIMLLLVKLFPNRVDGHSFIQILVICILHHLIYFFLQGALQGQ